MDTREWFDGVLTDAARKVVRNLWMFGRGLCVMVM